MSALGNRIMALIDALEKVSSVTSQEMRKLITRTKDVNRPLDALQHVVKMDEALDEYKRHLMAVVERCPSGSPKTRPLES